MTTSAPESLQELLQSATTPEDLEALAQLLDEVYPPQLQTPPTRTHQTAAERSRKEADRQNAKTALSQEVAPLPPVRDPARRARCKFDLRAAILTYFSAAVFKGLAPYQEEMIAAFQDVILHGGKQCRAVRRGGLKSTLARIATAWAVLYGHRKFPVLVGATDDKSNEGRDNFFKALATSKPLLEDFPELLPLLRKWKNPKKQLLFQGQPLTASARDERGCILFPAIPGAELSEARLAPYSILATDVSGLAFVDDDGRTVRPDLLIFDDVQTPQSAKSYLLTEARENAVCTTFMGLAGLGETIAAIMVCTAREAGDLTARFCDRSAHPDWDGRRFPVLLAEPDGKDALTHWAAYGQKLREGDTPAEGFALATAYYQTHRADMDAGGIVAWDADKEDNYLSALQWAMTKKILQPDFFRCELQQEGAPPVAGLTQLSGESIVKRLSNIKRGTVPANATYLTAYIDSSDHVLWWVVCAWAGDFSGWIVDYGTWPDQGRQQFYKNHLQATLEQRLPGKSWEEAFTHAHNELEAQLLGNDWPAEDGIPRQVDLLLKDWSDGDHKPRIAAQINASKHKAKIRPSKGHAPKPGRKAVHLWGDARRDRQTGTHWVERRTETPKHVQYDTNRWKAFIAQRLKTVVGAPSCLLLPGDDDRALTLLAEHLTAEQARPIVWDGTPGTVYELLPGRDNDWFDCVVGNAVAASMLGCSLPGEARPAKPIQQNQRGREPRYATI